MGGWYNNIRLMHSCPGGNAFPGSGSPRIPDLLPCAAESGLGEAIEPCLGASVVDVEERERPSHCHGDVVFIAVGGCDRIEHSAALLGKEPAVRHQ